MKTLFLLLLSLILVLPTSAQLAPPQEIHVSYQNISLTYDASLGTSVQLETIPAVDTSEDLPWWGLLPQHQQITLQDYAQNREFIPGRMMLFPADAYQQIGGEMVTTETEQLRGPVSNSATLPDVDQLPYLPQVNAHQVFHAQTTSLDFEGGAGIRYVTAYAQGPWPLAESEIFYTFHSRA